MLHTSIYLSHKEAGNALNYGWLITKETETERYKVQITQTKQ